MDIPQRLFKSILESIHESVYAVDRNWKVIYMNPAAERLTGQALCDARGNFCQGIFHSDHCGERCPLLGTLQNDVAIRDMRMTITRKDGQPLNVLVNTAILKDNAGEDIGGIITFRPMASQYSWVEALDGEDHFEGIYGHDRSMIEIFDMIEQVAPLDVTVLITGESGTGKELVANAVVARSKRADKPYVTVNCSVLSENLLESELFGHVKGSFTGAYADHIGRFERGDGGTVFLDEIGEASLNVQLKLLRVIQEREFERVGDSRTRKVDVRIVAATNQDLKKLIAAGRFREDLYYRLSAVRLELPPLRDRGGDILLLIHRTLDKLKRRTGYSKAELSDDSFERLIGYSWPGNVRELENALEYCLIRAHGELVTVSHLPPEIREETPIKQKKTDELTEEARILKALHDSRWNRSRASRLLGISRTSLWRLMKKYHMGMR